LAFSEARVHVKDEPHRSRERDERELDQQIVH
jgi:hypothetical protein